MDNLNIVYRPGLILRQNKHVLRALRGMGAPQKSGHKPIYFIRLKNTP
jgi:hypothetical protein